MAFDRLVENSFPKNDFAIIFNKLSSFEVGMGHWCLLFNSKNTNQFVFVDSLHNNMDIEVHQIIEQRFSKGDYLITNNMCLQTSFSMICGYLCLFILDLLIRGFGFRHILLHELNLDSFKQIEDRVVKRYHEIN